MLCVPRTSSFILTQFFVLNLDGWYDVLSTLSYYCIYLSSSLICVLFSGNLYLSFGISIDFLSFCETVTGEYFVSLLEILLPVKSSVTSAVFWVTLLKVVLTASVASFSAWSRSFWLYLPLNFLSIFLSMFLAK